MRVVLGNRRLREVIRRTYMALQTACASSKEERIMPLLSPSGRARHEQAKRVDSVPLSYAEMSGEELDRRIGAARAALGERLVILGHHYQRDEIIKYADYRGDSFKLAQLAAARPQADYIVFCGVHFMAESADILSGPHQKVILPDLDAGCTMADMAEIGQVEDCWDQVTAVVGQDIVPVTYMNSAASLKALVGREGGAV